MAEIADLPPIIATYLAAYRDYDLPTIIACVSEDLVFEQVSNTSGITRIVGREAFAAAAAMSAWPAPSG